MRLMIITHDPARRTCLREFLSTKGHEVVIPPHRQDMLSMVKQTTPHVIVLDLFVKEPSGAEILRALRSSGYKGKVIALASSSAYTSSADCLRTGVDQVVGGVQVTGGPLDPAQVDGVIRASFQSKTT